MNKGIYIALSGAVLKQRHMDIFAQNVANSNTTGYKKERISFRDYLIPADTPSGVVEDGRSMTQLSEQVTDFLMDLHSGLIILWILPLMETVFLLLKMTDIRETAISRSALMAVLQPRIISRF